MNTKSNFKIEYDGPALTNHDIDVRDLAPALLALTDIFDESNRLINGSTSKAIIKIQAPLKEGSFGVDLILIHDWINCLTDLFTTKGASASANLIQIVTGLMAFILWLKSRGISHVKNKDNNKSEIVTTDGDTTIINSKVIMLFQNINIRKSLEITVKTPLEKEGISQFKLIDNDGMQEVIVNQSERDYFATPPIQDVLIEEREYDKTIQIVSVSFEKGYKWRFSDGQSVFTADISDEEFINRVRDSQEIFRKDDYMKVRIKSKQWDTSQGLKTETQILKVIEHRSATQQIEIPYDKD